MPSLTGIGAAVAAFIYGSGFLVVAFHHGAYGIHLPDLLRTRVLAAGILFVVCFLLPAVALARTNRLFGFGNNSPIVITAEKENRWALRFCVACDSIFASVVETSMLGSILTGKTLFENSKSLWDILGSLCLFILCSEYQKKWINTHPIRCVCLSAASALAIGFAFLTDLSKPGILLFIWFAAVPLEILLFRQHYKVANGWRGLNWEQWAIIWVATIGWFSFIYSSITPKLGGGAPVQIEMSLERNAPFCHASRCLVSLIDETGDGFYVVDNVSSRAYFIRRAEVRTIAFSKN